MTEIRIDNLHKTFGSDVRALNAFSLTVESGDIVSLVGPSGCGKTTLLRCIAGFEHPQSGRIEIGDQTIVAPKTWVAPEKRNVGFVFQEQALFPHLSVENNVLFGVKERRADQRRTIAAGHLERVGLAGLSARFPHELSGGQQRRVALARVLAQQPRVVLLDEPLNGLDESLRESVRDEVHSLLRETETTAIWVTHRATDALAVSDKIAVLQRGELAQFGAGLDIYQNPTSIDVARIFGAMNLVDATYEDGWVTTAMGRFRHDGAVGSVGIRPEQISVSKPGDGDGVKAITIAVAFEGSTMKVDLRLPDESVVVARTSPKPNLSPGATVTAKIRDGANLSFF